MIKAAVLGSPISHSLSPLLHTVAYTELGLESDYTRIEVKSGELGAFLLSCQGSWTGFSLTMPLKEEVLSLATENSELAARIRSANTLLHSDANWSASTTDVAGFTHALGFHNLDARGEVLIIGGGATARAAAAACDGVASTITVMNRSESRFDAISQSVESSNLVFTTWSDHAAFETADLIISTTPEGASDSLIPYFPTKPTGVFLDVLYKPWPTKSLVAWSGAGGQTIDGLDLLIHQGIDQVSLFSGHIFERAPMASIMREAALKMLKAST
ncbi:unannotated protein [freshwater metagenome]|uniref:Unannotated protein n=1 Tax=freshwater metagenome TaxID=449393 RepID=A0A6J6XTT1_9ZZZZ|nr:shikimate dehydrogenase [Actinomycetota bacterium]MSW62453.1 shikimate dehydrogenase [Actinomycetota bacterium]MSX89546.1 shikimate dehydrogenase [Actinomycetota bacterium]MTA57668.1 shikimate dehydrogenase [Actinomycetota bacterium]